MILAFVEPCWAATRLPAIESMDLIGLPFFTRNCAPVTKNVRLKSTDSRRVRVSVMVPAIRSTAFELSRGMRVRSEEHTSELQSRPHLVCRLLLEKKKKHQLYTQARPQLIAPRAATYDDSYD